MNMSSETNLVGCRVLSVFESDWLHWLQDRRFDDGTESGIVWHSRQFFAFNHQRDAIYRLDGGQYVYCGNFGQLSAAWSAVVTCLRQGECKRSWPRTTEYWLKFVPWWRGFFLVLGGAPRFHPNFTDKEPFLEHLSVIKTHFTDKPPFSGDLSVNFWPLWWGFTDKAGFLDHLSVKPRLKRLNFYGQTTIFAHFVRNRHFSGGPITDKESIFIDLSVNDNDFAKCSAAHHLLNRCTWVRLRSKRRFLRCARNLSQHCFGEGNRVEHFLNFSRFCSTFGAARTGFGGSGRTFFQFFEILFYFRDRADRIWRQR